MSNVTILRPMSASMPSMINRKEMPRLISKKWTSVEFKIADTYIGPIP
jgi:hypothetical protein